MSSKIYPFCQRKSAFYVPKDLTRRLKNMQLWYFHRVFLSYCERQFFMLVCDSKEKGIAPSLQSYRLAFSNSKPQKPRKQALCCRMTAVLRMPIAQRAAQLCSIAMLLFYSGRGLGRQVSLYFISHTFYIFEKLPFFTKFIIKYESTLQYCHVDFLFNLFDW